MDRWEVDDDEHRQKYMTDNVVVRVTIAIMKYNNQK